MQRSSTSVCVLLSAVLFLVSTSGPVAAQECTAGRVGGLACDSVDLLANMALEDFVSEPSSASDVWGFRDMNTEREYAFVGLRRATSIVDVTDAARPVEVGSVAGPASGWRDIGVLQIYDTDAERWRAYAYVVTEVNGDGLRVIDLSGLPNAVNEGALFTGDFQGAHNLHLAAADYATGIALVGSEPLLHVAGADRGGGAFRTFSLTDPLRPTLIGSNPDGVGSQYMHDAASIRYRDERVGRCSMATELCSVLLDFNEDRLQLWDLSLPAQPSLLGELTYAGVGYVHSGWPSEDGDFVYVQDELDERDGSVTATTLRVVSIQDTRAPAIVGRWTGPTTAIDHNGFVRGNRYYMSNYTRGLTILDISEPSMPVTAGYLDTYPPNDGLGFDGAWGVFPFLPSGVLLVSDVDGGLFLLTDRTLDVPQGSLAFSRPSYGTIEGNALTVEVDRLGGLQGAVSVDYEVLAASAGEDDATLARGTLQWADGSAAPENLLVTPIADGLAEGTERLLIRLANPTGGATLGRPATISVFLSDPGDAAVIDVSDVSVAGTQPQAVLTLRRRGDVTSAAAVDYRVSDGSAIRDEDFTGPPSGQLSWSAGDGRAQTLVFPLIADGDGGEAEESFTVALSNPVNATLVTTDATVTILADPTATPNPRPTEPTVSGGGGGHPLMLIALLTSMILFRKRLPDRNC